MPRLLVGLKGWARRGDPRGKALRQRLVQKPCAKALWRASPHRWLAGRTGAQRRPKRRASSTYIVMAYIVMVHIGMAHIGAQRHPKCHESSTYIVMADIVMAYIVMAQVS